jgi:FCD domain
VGAEAGDYIFVPPHLPHREENPGPNTPAELVIARSSQEGRTKDHSHMHDIGVAFGDLTSEVIGYATEAQRLAEDGDAYAIAQSSTAFHEAVVETSANDLMMRLIQTISGRITWLFHLTSGLPVEQAFHDDVLLRDAIASGTDRVDDAVAHAHIERDRQTSRSFAPNPYGHRVPRTAVCSHELADP